MIAPQERIFNEIMLQCNKIHDKVYPYLPSDKVAYPFIYVGEQYDIDLFTKTMTYGQVTQRVHVYGHIDKRGSTGKLANEVRTMLRQLKKVKGFNVSVRRLDRQVLMDQTTPTPLWHFILEVQYVFN